MSQFERSFFVALLVAVTSTGHAQSDPNVELARRTQADLVFPGCAGAPSTASPLPEVAEVLQEQVARVAADAAVRRLLPIVLRSLGLTDEAGHFEAVPPTRDEASLASLGDDALRLANRLRDASPTGLSGPNSRRAQRAARLAWGATFPLRRLRSAPASAVVEMYRDLFAVAHRIDAAASCRIAADVVAGADAVIRANR